VRPYAGGRLSSDDIHAVRRAQREVADLDASRMRLDPIPSVTQYYDTVRQFVAAVAEGDAKAQAVRDHCGLDALGR